MTAVSIIIPCYNAEATIAETVESALGQGADVEVIVVDDGSTDRSGEVLSGFSDRILILTGPNGGVSAARNRGFAQAKGDWILFLDSDDLLLAGTLAERLAVGAKADVVVCDWQEFTETEHGVSDGALRQIDAASLAQDAEAAIASHIWAPPAAVLYRRWLVEAIGGFRRDLPVIQDARFLFDAALHGGRFVYLPRLGARYRILPASLSRRNPEAFHNDILTNGLQMEALWRAKGELSASRQAVLADIFNHAARGLFGCGGARYFEAVEAQRRAGHLTRHAQLATPLARLVGLSAARRLFALGRVT